MRNFKLFISVVMFLTSVFCSANSAASHLSSQLQSHPSILSLIADDLRVVQRVSQDLRVVRKDSIEANQLIQKGGQYAARAQKQLKSCQGNRLPSSEMICTQSEFEDATKIYLDTMKDFLSAKLYGILQERADRREHAEMLIHQARLVCDVEKKLKDEKLESWMRQAQRIAYDDPDGFKHYYIIGELSHDLDEFELLFYPCSEDLDIAETVSHRRVEIDEIVKEVEGLLDVFRDLKFIVQGQGKTLDEMESHLNDVLNSVLKAVKDLKIAGQLQQRGWCCL